jgi:hypothetical protein
MGHGVGPEQTLTEREELGSTAIGQEPEETDTNEAAGQNMEEETAQELLRGQCHLPLLMAVSIILPAKGNLVAVEGHEAVVGDGNAMSVSGEIAQHMMGTAERWLGVDDPVLTKQGTQEGAEGLFVGQGLKSSGEGELVLLESAF